MLLYRIVLLSAFVLGSGTTANACQESCVQYEISSSYGVLRDFYQHPIPGARLVVRDASLSARGPKTICSQRKGPVVRSLKTARDGTFSLKGLRAGPYWITYMHKEIGESFLVEITESLTTKQFELVVDGYIHSNVCYTVDIERNETKPPGWNRVPVDALPEEIAEPRRQISVLFNSGFKVKVELKDGSRFEGAITEVNDNDFVVTDGVRYTTLRFSAVKRIKRAKEAIQQR